MMNRLTEVLNEFFHGNAPGIGPSTVLTADLGLTSMELFDLVCTIEESFGVEIPDRMLPKFVTVQDVVEYLEAAV